MNLPELISNLVIIERDLIQQGVEVNDVYLDDDDVETNLIIDCL